MNVLVLASDFPPLRGGIQTWMFELARRLPDARVTVVAPASPGDRAFDAAAGVRVRRLRDLGLGRLPWLVCLGAVTLVTCLLRRPTLIVCGHVLTAPAAVLPSRLLGIPYVVFAYAWEIRTTRWRRLVRLVLRQAALVLAASHFTARSVLAHGVALDRVRILHPGVAPDRFASEADAGAASAARPTQTILTVSRLNERYKGHDTVIRALPLIRAKCPDVRYVVAGDGRLLAFLEKLAACVGVGELVTFAGEVSDDRLPDVYRSADVVVQVSRESLAGGGVEGFGIVCLEAAAVGKPVVAGRSGGLPEAVRDGVTGILVDPNDVGAVADAITSLLGDAPLVWRLGQAGRERALREFTWDLMAERARRLFGEVRGQP